MKRNIIDRVIVLILVAIVTGLFIAFCFGMFDMIDTALLKAYK